MLGPGVGQSVVALARRLGKSQARATYLATLAAVRTVQALIATTGIDCELAMTGQLMVARTPGGRRRLQQTLAVMQELDLPVEALDDEATTRRIRLQPLRPHAGPDPAALYFATAGTLHPVKLLSGLLLRVRALGGKLYEGARVHRLEETDEATAVRLFTASGQVLAEQVVLATAGYTPTLGVLRGRVLPVHLQALVTEPLDPATLAAIGWAGREGVLDARRVFGYLRLTADDRIILGGGPPRYCYGGSPREFTSPAAQAALRHELAHTFPPSVQLRIARTWSGVIGYVVDAIPTIGRTSPRVLHLCGWCGHGVALATAAGQWAAQLLDPTGLDQRSLPWFRATAPLVPTELARYVGFGATVATMTLLDRLDR
jgi:gamma-glutamylputrescine oxidase